MQQSPPKLEMTAKQSTLPYELGRRLGYQDLFKVYPPAPCDMRRWDHFNILQVNISGLQHKVDELLTLLQEQDVRIALIQETILPKKPTDIRTTGYTQFKCECTKCQGVMTLIHNDTHAEIENHTVDDIDMQKVTRWIEKQRYNWTENTCD